MSWFSNNNEWDEGYGYICRQLHTGGEVNISGLKKSKKFLAGARAALTSITQLSDERGQMMAAVQERGDGLLTELEDLKAAGRKKLTKIEKELYSLRSANASMTLVLEEIKRAAEEGL